MQIFEASQLHQEENEQDKKGKGPQSWAIAIANFRGRAEQVFIIGLAFGTSQYTLIPPRERWTQCLLLVRGQHSALIPVQIAQGSPYFTTVCRNRNLAVEF